MTTDFPDPASLAARPFEYGGHEFRVAPLGGYENLEHLVIVKPYDAVRAYLELLATFENPRMIEIGIAYGGSVGLLALAAAPTKMVALELAAQRIPLLDRLLAEEHLDERVSLHYGIDQEDRATLRRILATEFGGSPIDLVIDDASHFYGPSVASFEVLFPALRPGGRYLIEDWSCDHEIRSLLAVASADETSPLHAWARAAFAGDLGSRHDGQQPQTAVAATAIRRRSGDVTTAPAVPLSRLGVELVHGVAEPHSGIRSARLGPYWIEVERDDTELPDDFSLAQACPDHFETVRSLT